MRGTIVPQSSDLNQRTRFVSDSDCSSWTGLEPLYRSLLGRPLTSEADVRKWLQDFGDVHDDEFLAIDVRVIDAAGMEMLPEQTDGDLLDIVRGPQRAQLLVEPDEEIPFRGRGADSTCLTLTGN